ncbi:Nuclear RNA export factor 1 [Fasciola gigantica]|uniref:Nuclear RNA export factor 1 n=1 Tax=Fasciola gigantica TaxID=46835 RepID=A0A504YG21_FASGI|nr:Nuclear RNA export factor 1 [Fasciola gigantica]
MPCRGKNRGKHFNWNKGHFRDHQDDGSGDHRSVSFGLQCRDQGRNRKSFPPGGNTEMIKRAVAMNLLPTPSNALLGAQNTGLGPGEIWACITVVQGILYPLNSLQEVINNALGTQLRFYNACFEGRNAVLYAKIREKQLVQYSKSLQSLRDPNNGRDQLVTELTPVSEPRVPPSPSNPTPTAQNIGTLLPESWMEALRACFRERFQPTTRSLDLSSLHTEPILLSQGLYLPLNKSSVVHAMISILKENGAQLSLLNLSNNRLPHMNSFSLLAANRDGEPAVSIERIDLSANPLTGVTSLGGLRGIAKLIELDISETPLASRFQQSDRALATKLVKILPGIKRLNGRDLPTVVQFAVEGGSGRKGPSNTPRIPLPESVLGYFPSEAVRMPLLGFLKEYFTRFDSQPRGENILSYYTSASQMVVSTATEFRGIGSSHHNNSSSHSSNSNTPATARIESVAAGGTVIKTYLTTSRLSHPYYVRSRNLLRCRDDIRRRDLIIIGPIAIAAFLDELPATEHPLESFTVDVTFHSDTQILFTVTGVFYELQSLSQSGSGSSATNNPTQKATRKTLRCFTRTMILVAPGGHIVQDDLIISNPTPSLCKRYITDVAAKAQSTNNPASSSASTPASAPAVAVPSVVIDPAIQLTLLNEIRARTGMNEAFARQCLSEYAWNLDEAFNAFQTLNAAGRIPRDAFT